MYPLPTWKEFAWAVFLYSTLYRGDPGEEQYLKLIAQTGPGALRNQLTANPAQVSQSRFTDQIIKFLNMWRCRVVTKTGRAARQILIALQRIQPQLISLSQLSTTQSLQQVQQQAIIDCYAGLRTAKWKIGQGANRTRRLGPTATAKLLHVLLPDLIVMWDEPICLRYTKHKSTMDVTPKDFLEFQKTMQETASRIHSSFKQARLNPPAQPNETPAAYLAKRLELVPARPMAKLLDEYNWVSITRGAQISPTGPNWHPDK